MKLKIELLARAYELLCSTDMNHSEVARALQVSDSTLRRELQAVITHGTSINDLKKDQTQKCYEMVSIYGGLNGISSEKVALKSGLPSTTVSWILSKLFAAGAVKRKLHPGYKRKYLYYCEG